MAGFETLNASNVGSVPCKDDDWKPLDASYTPEQREIILKLLNNASLPELVTVKSLRGRKSQNIIDYRTENGPFRTLESLVNVPRLKHKSAVVVFNSILNPVKEERKVKVVRYIRPEVEKAWLEEASSIVSIVCGTNKIAWAQVNRAMKVLEWKQMDCPNFLKGSYMASSYLTDVSAVVDIMPEADLYIIEKCSISTHNTNLFPLITHMRTVEAMLFALLEPKIPQPVSNTPPRVLNMSRSAVGRHFGLMVHYYRTSGAQTVKRLMTESVTEKLPRINFPTELLVKHRNSFEISSQREGKEMCDALLQALAFYELLSESSG